MPCIDLLGTAVRERLPLNFFLLLLLSQPFHVPEIALEAVFSTSQALFQFFPLWDRLNSQRMATRLQSVQEMIVPTCGLVCVTWALIGRHPWYMDQEEANFPPARRQGGAWDSWTPNPRLARVLYLYSKNQTAFRATSQEQAVAFHC